MLSKAVSTNAGLLADAFRRLITITPTAIRVAADIAIIADMLRNIW
jgi:hypothetical protein